MKELGYFGGVKVFALDEPGSGNANHKYNIHVKQSDSHTITFQDGPLLEVGQNGVINESLLVIVIDRLQCFQTSKFSCRENALALTKLEEAMHWLNHRTESRKTRGVEGTHTV